MLLKCVHGRGSGRMTPPNATLQRVIWVNCPAFILPSLTTTQSQSLAALRGWWSVCLPPPPSSFPLLPTLLPCYPASLVRRPFLDTTGPTARLHACACFELVLESSLGESSGGKRSKGVAVACHDMHDAFNVTRHHHYYHYDWPQPAPLLICAQDGLGPFG
jgi:hypothetical protein